MRLQILIHNDQSMIQVSYTPQSLTASLPLKKGGTKEGDPASY